MFFIYIIVLEVWKKIAPLYAALKNFGPVFEELNKGVKKQTGGTWYRLG